MNLIEQASRECLGILRRKTPISFAEPRTTAHQVDDLILVMSELVCEKLSFFTRCELTDLLLLVVESQNFV